MKFKLSLYKACTAISSLNWIAHFEVPLNTRLNLSFNTIKKPQKPFESIFKWNLVPHIHEMCLLSAQLSICVSSPDQCSYTKLLVTPTTKLNIIAQPEPRVRITSFKISHYRAADGLLPVRTSTDFSHHGSFTQRWHQPQTKYAEKTRNRFENYILRYLANHR